MRKVVFAEAVFGLSVGLLSTYVVAQSEFGSPPSGRVPILYNDHHVYARPDELRAGRVLAALVQGRDVLVPLRAMLEQMGGRVDYDPQTRSVIVSRADTVLSLTVGRNVVVINGDARPLDVPPRVVDGRVLVPLRVLAEGLGAYVQWQPALRSVVVRYRGGAPASPVAFATAPPPPAAPTAPPTSRPVIPPGPPPPRAPRQDETFVVGDALLAPRVADEFASGRGGGGSFEGRFATEFSLLDLPFVVETRATRVTYRHPGGPVTVLGGGGQVVVPPFDAREDETELHLAVGVAPTRIYAGLGVLRLATDYGYPVTTGLGAGVQKAPDLDQNTSLYGDAWYYPDVSGACPAAVCPAGGTLARAVVTYRVGATALLGGRAGRVFLDAGYRGERRRAKSLAPVDTVEQGPYAGLGIRF